MNESTYTIRFERMGVLLVLDAGGTKFWLPFALRVERANSPIRAVSVTVSEMLCAVNGLNDPDKYGNLEPAIVRWALGRIEAMIRIGSFPTEYDSHHLELELERIGLDAVEMLVAVKVCKYQYEDQGDLYCSAAHPKDISAVGTIGLRTIAPTSRPVCADCNLPDTDYLCSAFVQLKVSYRGATDNPHKRELVTYQCDAGREEIRSDPTKCKAGGHGCWRRSIPVGRQLSHPPFSPRELLMSIDFLDHVWRATFGQGRLFRHGNVDVYAGLARAASSIDDFRSRMSDLANVLNLLSVPSALLPPDQRSIPERNCFDRLEAALESKLSDAEKPAVREAVAVLRAAVTARNELQHLGSQQALRAALSLLGVGYPIDDYDSAWDTIRAVVTDSLATIRGATEGIAS
jgi:hypothetical protein